MEAHTTTAVIEALLFVYGEPVSKSRLMRQLNISQEDLDVSIRALSDTYAAANRGLALVEQDDMMQLTTKGEYASVVEKCIKSVVQESLSKAALEVLSVIAYRGPVSRAQIEAIRGVNCSVVLRNLLMRELIERTESQEGAREYSYSASLSFLKELGIHSIKELPEYDTLSHDERLTAVTHPSEEKQNNL